MTFAAKLGRNEDDRFTTGESGWEPDINSGSGISEEKVGDLQAGIIMSGNSPIKPIAPTSLNSISTRSIIPISPGNSMPLKATEGAQSSFIPAVGASASPVVPPQSPSASVGTLQSPQPPPVPLPSVSKPALPISQPSSSLRLGSSTQPAQTSPSSQLLQPSVSAPQMKPPTVPSVSQPPVAAQNLKPSSIPAVYNPSDTVSPPVGQNRPTLVITPNQLTMSVKPEVSAIESVVSNTPFSAKPSPYTQMPQPAQSLKVGPSASAFSKVSGVVKSSSYAKVPQVSSSVSVLPNPSLLSQVKISPKSSQVTPLAPVSAMVPKPQVTTQVLTSSVSQSEFNHAGHPNASILPKTRFQSLIEGSENKKTENGISDKKLSSKDSLNIEGSTNIVDITQGSGSGFGEGITAEEQHIATALAQDTRRKQNKKSSKPSEQDPAKMINNNVEKSLEDYYKHQEPFTFSRRPIAKNINKPKKLLEKSTKSRPQALGNKESRKSIQIKSFRNKVSHEGTFDTLKEQQPVVIEGIHNGQLEGDTDTPHEQPLPRLPPPLITINVEPPVQKVKPSDQLTENESGSDAPEETADITVRESSEGQNKGSGSPQETIVEVKIGFTENHQGVPSDQTFSQEKRKEEIDIGKEQRRHYRRYNSHAKQPEPTPAQEDNMEDDDTYDYIHDDDDGKKMISKKSEQNQIKQHPDTNSDEKPSHEETGIEGKSRNNTKHKHKRHHHHGKHKKLQQKRKGKSADDSNQVFNHDSNNPESQLLKDDLSRYVEVNGFITTVGDQSEENNTHGETSEEHSSSENGEGSGKKKHSHKKRRKKKHKRRHHRRHKHHNRKSEDLGAEETKVEMLPLTTESIGEVSDININDNLYSLGRKSGHRRHKKHHRHHHHKHHRKSPYDMTFNNPEELENMNGYTMLEKDLSENPILETLPEKVRKHKKRKHHRRRRHRHRHHHNHHHEGEHYHHRRHHHRKHD